MRQGKDTEGVRRLALLAAATGLLTSVFAPLTVPDVQAADLDGTGARSISERGTTPAVNWQTGAELYRELSQPVRLQWKLPLRRAVDSLARDRRVAIFLDRRVDPDQEVELSAQDVELQVLLDKIAADLRQGICRVGPVVYLGPGHTTSVLATVVALRGDDEERLPAGVRHDLRRPRPLRWPDLATPREVVAQIAREAVVRAEGIERLPHDLWPETDLPPLTFAQRLSLVLAGFDLSYQYEGGGQTVRLIALPDKAVVRREYARPGLNARTLAEIRQRFPQARIVQETAPLMIEATVEQHEAIRQWLAGPAKQPKQPGRQKPLEHRHTLTVQRATLRAVADSLEKQLGLTIQFDPAVTGKLKEMVSFEVKNATLDELLRAWLEPAGLTYQMDEQRILILPSPDR